MAEKEKEKEKKTKILAGKTLLDTTGELGAQIPLLWVFFWGFV